MGIREQAKELAELSESLGTHENALRYIHLRRMYSVDIARTLLEALDFIEKIANHDICDKCEDQLRARDFLNRIGCGE